MSRPIISHWHNSRWNVLIKSWWLESNTWIQCPRFCKDGTFKVLEKTLNQLSYELTRFHKNFHPLAAYFQDLLEKFQWDNFEHPPYSCSLGLPLLSQLKWNLCGRRFPNYNKMSKIAGGMTLDWKNFDHRIKNLLKFKRLCRKISFVYKLLIK